MTETTTSSAEPPPDEGDGPQIPIHPTDILIALIVAFLAPMFLGAGNSDIGLARLAAMETLNAYRARNQADLLAVAQIVAFGLAALGSLSLSMADNLSVAMTLRLRGNANGLGRSAEQLRRGREPGSIHAPSPAPQLAPPPREAHDPAAEAALVAGVTAVRQAAAELQGRMRDARETEATPSAATPSAAPPSATPPSAGAAAPAMTEARQSKVAWANAMANVAGEYTASLATLQPEAREDASRRAAILAGAARALLAQAGAPPQVPAPAPAAVRTEYLP